MFHSKPIIVLKFAKQGIPGRTGPMGLPGQDAISWEAVVTMEGVKNGECTIKLYKDGKLANNEIHYAAVHVMGTRSNFYTLSNEYSRTISGTYTFQYRDVRGIFVIIYEDSFAENVLTAATATMIRGRDVKILQCAPLTFTAAEWRAKGAKGVSNVWTTGATYDNSDLEDGDTVIISGTVSDQLDQHDVAVSGMILGKAQIPMGADASQSVTVVSQTFVIGPAGAAATVQVGTVTTLPYDADATVVNSGTPNNAIFDIGIPRGTPGEAVNTLPFDKITGNPTDNTALSSALSGKVAKSGDTMTGQLLTSFKNAVATGSYQSTATTVSALMEEVRYSSGCCGSVNLSAYTGSPASVPAGWYNFLYIPHRSGGVNGNASGDNCNYGRLLLFGMTVNDEFVIRYSNGSIAYCRKLFTNADTIPVANGGTGNNAGKAASVVDNGNKSTAITFQYSGDGLTSATWFAVWSGYSVRPMNAANMRTNLGGICARPDYSISTTDLTAGTSNLTNNQIYFVYA